MSLSEKIKMTPNKYCMRYVWVVDVQEAVKRLKEEYLSRFPDADVSWIDEIFGDKLI